MNHKKIILKILKNIVKGNKNINESMLKISEDDFFEISILINEEGYVKNISICLDSIGYNCASITMLGIEYIDKNKWYIIFFNFLKEINPFNPFTK